MTILDQQDRFAYDAMLDIAHDVSYVRPEALPALIAGINELASLDIPFLEIVVCYLPKVGKWYDSCLSSRKAEDGSRCIRDVSDTCPPGTIFWPPFVEDIHGGLMGELDLDNLPPEEVSAVRQLLYTFKKWSAPCPIPKVEAAVAEFLAVEAGLRSPRSVDNDLLFHVVGGKFEEGLHPSDGDHLRELVKTMDALARRMQPTSWVDVASIVPSHGPGAVSDLDAGEDKYTFPSYPSVIDEVLPSAYFCGHRWGVNDDVALCGWKHAARLVAVPKTIEKPRLIASEPVVHQYLQQALMKWIRANICSLHKVMIDFQSQVPSQQGALRASKTGELATVDLEAASDRLSLWAVESMYGWSPDFLDLLVRTRSSHIYDGIVTKEFFELRKFAPMGSATTFPVQSTVYATAALAATLVANNLSYVHQHRWTHRKLHGIARSIRVFGDDIMLPSNAVPNLVQLLEFLQLKVNTSKTHSHGFFRESCGMDAYRGHSVTPVYISQVAPRSPGSALDAYVEQSNNAHRAGLWRLASTMTKALPYAMRRLVPVSSEDVGVIALDTFNRGTQADMVRYNARLHRYEVKGFAAQPAANRRRRDHWCSLLQYFLEEPGPETKWASGYNSRLRPKYRAWWVDARVSDDPRTDYPS